MIHIHENHIKRNVYEALIMVLCLGTGTFQKEFDRNFCSENFPMISKKNTIREYGISNDESERLPIPFPKVLPQ